MVCVPEERIWGKEYDIPLSRREWQKMTISPAEDAFFIVPFAPLVYAIRGNYTPEVLDYPPIVPGTATDTTLCPKILWLGWWEKSVSPDIAKKRRAD